MLPFRHGFAKCSTELCWDLEQWAMGTCQFLIWLIPETLSPTKIPSLFHSSKNSGLFTEGIFLNTVPKRSFGKDVTRNDWLKNLLNFRLTWTFTGPSSHLLLRLRPFLSFQFFGAKKKTTLRYGTCMPILQLPNSGSSDRFRQFLGTAFQQGFPRNLKG